MLVSGHGYCRTDSEKKQKQINMGTKEKERGFIIFFRLVVTVTAMEEVTKIKENKISLGKGRIMEED